MEAISKGGIASLPAETDFVRMMNWPRQFHAIQTAVSAAGDDLERVLQIVLRQSLRLVPSADGGEIDLREGREFVCKATCGTSTRAPGQRSPAGGIVPGFCTITLQGRSTQRSSINAPIPFEGQHVGLLRLHSRTPDAFTNHDLLALQLLAGQVTQGLVNDAHARGEKARREADRRFAATFEQAAVGIAHVAPDGRFILVNDKFCDIAGHEREALIAHGFEGITHPEDLEADLAHVSDLLSGTTDSFSMEKRYVRGDGSIVWVNLTVSLVRKPDGEPDFFVSVVEDISARRAAEFDAEQDALTGLLNRRGALRRLQRVESLEGAWQDGVAAVFIDLNDFKVVNDRFGHAEGDRCLIKIAAALRKSLRGDDVIARMGGDEFFALFPASSEDLIKEVLARMQVELTTVSDGEPWDVGASFGVAIVPAGVTVDPARILNTADRLMYKAKHGDSSEPLIATLQDMG